MSLVPKPHEQDHSSTQAPSLANGTNKPSQTQAPKWNIIYTNKNIEDTSNEMKEVCNNIANLI